MKAESRAVYVVGQQDGEDGGGASHGTRGEVELSTDHEQRYRNGHQAEVSRDVEEVGGAADGAERR